MLHTELKTTHETGCENLFPCKIITCPTLHVRPTFADSPLHELCTLRIMCLLGLVFSMPY